MKRTTALFQLIIMVYCLAALAGCYAAGSGSAASPALGSISAPAGTFETSGTPPNEMPPLSGKKVYELIVQDQDPPDSICGQYVEAWGKTVEDASGGRIKFNYFFEDTLVGAEDAVNAVFKGTADICWSAAAIHSGKFPISEFIQLPLSGITCARMGSEVMQDMYDEIPALRTEYSDFKVLMLGSCTYAPISTTTKKLTTIADIQGLRIRAPGSTCALWSSAVGMSPIPMATPDTTKMLKRGVIEGCLNDWQNITALKLYENLKNIMDYPTPGSPIFLLMNKDKYELMPSDLQAIIDRYSGEYASKMAGIYWDSARTWIYDNAKELGLEIYEPSDELYAYFTNVKVKENVHKQYIEYLNGFGLNGQAIYDKCTEIVSRYTAEYADPWAQSVSIEDFKG